MCIFDSIFTLLLLENLEIWIAQLTMGLFYCEIPGGIGGLENKMG